jgi:hypothetical protein
MGDGDVVALEVIVDVDLGEVAGERIVQMLRGFCDGQHRGPHGGRSNSGPSWSRLRTGTVPKSLSDFIAGCGISTWT